MNREKTKNLDYKQGYKDGKRAAHNWVIESMEHYLRAYKFEYDGEEATGQDLLEYIKQKVKSIDE